MSLVSSSRPYRAVISETTVGARTIVSAVANKRIVVLNVVLTVASGNTVTWRSGTTSISGPMSDSYTAGDAHSGLIESDPGEALILNLATVDQISGHLTYVLLP